MLLDDAASIKAALATMNPIARDATQALASLIISNPDLIDDNEALKMSALNCCANSWVEAGNDLEGDKDRFQAFLENHGANTLDIGVSIVLCIIKTNQRRRRWGVVGKVAAAAGLIAVGAFFG